MKEPVIFTVRVPKGGILLMLPSIVFQVCSGKRYRNPPIPTKIKLMSQRRDLNPRPTVYETVALPLSYAG